MAEDTKVSIIVPVYNVEQYLQECIDSILSQTHRNLEIILVDDGTPDASGKIADENAAKDRRIKVIHKENGGVSSARNAGLMAVSGDYFCFADADDRLEKDYVDYLLQLALDNKTEVSLTTDLYTTFAATGEQDDSFEIVSGVEAACKILCYRMPIGVYCKLFSSELIRKGARFEEELFIGEGFNFNVDSFMLAKNVAVGHRKIYFYRKDNEASAMTRFRIDKIRCALKAIDFIERKHSKASNYFLKCVNFARWHTHCDMLFFIYNANAKRKFPEDYNRCYKVARKDALSAFGVRTNNRERIKALLTLIYPNTIAHLIRWRMNRHLRKNS